MMEAFVKSKWCTKCGNSKPLDGFYNDSRAKDGKQSWCKVCHNAINAKWRRDHPEESRAYMRAANRAWGRANPERRWATSIRSRYGITAEQYNALAEAQGNVCAICKKPETTRYRGSPRRLSVDHDHACCPGTRACGKCVRGLLCAYCNSVLGGFDLSAAASYLADPPALIALKDGPRQGGIVNW